VDSGTAYTTLIQQDMVPNEPTLKSLNDATNRSFTLALWIGKNRWKAAKQATITGPAGMGRASIIINPREIPDLSMIRVVSAMKVPMDRAQLLQFVAGLSSTQNPQIAPTLSQREYRRSLQAQGVQIPGVDLIDPNEEAAWRENLIIYGDGVTPGRVPEPNPRFEKYDIHLEAHQSFTATIEFQTASDAVKAAMDEHIQQTARSMGGQAIPGQFDADVQRSDSEDLENEIELAQAGRRPEDLAGKMPPEAMLAQMLAGIKSGAA
jgi:hypothetical protein